MRVLSEKELPMLMFFFFGNDHARQLNYDLSLITETLLILKIQTNIRPKQLISKSRNPLSGF